MSCSASHPKFGPSCSSPLKRTRNSQAIKTPESTENIKAPVSVSPKLSSSHFARTAPDSCEASDAELNGGAVELLDQERRLKEDALFELDQLQRNYDSLLLKYAEAKNMIDRQRFAGGASSVPDTSWPQLHDVISSTPYDDSAPISNVSESAILAFSESSVLPRKRQSCHELELNQFRAKISDQSLFYPKSTVTKHLPARGDEQSEFVECVTCSCPPTSRKHLLKPERANAKMTGQRDVSLTRTAVGKLTAVTHSMMSKNSARLRAQCLQDQVQISMIALQDGAMDAAVKVDHFSHLRFQLQDLRNEVERLEIAGVDVDSLEDIVSKLDVTISQGDDGEEWVSTSSSVTESSYESVEDVTSVEDEHIWPAGRNLSDSCDGFIEFKRDLNEKLVAIKSMMDTRTIKKRDHRQDTRTQSSSISSEPVPSYHSRCKPTPRRLCRKTDEDRGTNYRFPILGFQLSSPRDGAQETEPTRPVSCTRTTTSNDGRRRCRCCCCRSRCRRKTDSARRRQPR